MSVGRTERRPRGELARVLVVDDEEDIRELLDLTVARMGLSADCAGSVNEAKRLLEQQRYKLCITDMRLPDGDGLEIVRLISERYGETPVAVLTAHGSAQNAVAALKAGAFDYVAKDGRGVPHWRPCGRATDRPVSSYRTRTPDDRAAGAQPGAGIHFR